MLIPCPCCGARDVSEFSYGGDARQRQLPDVRTQEAWTDHVYLRANPRGVHAELWFHAMGCQQWLRLERNTTDNTLMAVRLCGLDGSEGVAP
ncbi:sarcosine oxidase subunit delta [Variovorax sp. VNK109]|uniref:sarcosine oxidase subunit delta n=1 Tax=Variovorax sp. VNK109 TaxID=3400919 RepID=UPI003C006BA9